MFASVKKVLEFIFSSVELPPELLGPVGAEVALVDRDHQRPVGHELSQEPAGPQPLIVKSRVLVVHQCAVDPMVAEVKVMMQYVSDSLQRRWFALQVGS